MQTLPVLHDTAPPDDCMMTGVSFVVPVHNGAAHLAEVIASIAAQDDGRPFEIVVVEDGSTDGSASMLESLALSYPITIVRGPCRGAADNSSRGAAAPRRRSRT